MTTGLVIRWHAKIEPHNNFVVIHTRGEEIQDYLEVYVGAQRDGSRFILEAEYTPLVVEELQSKGFVVG